MKRAALTLAAALLCSAWTSPPVPALKPPSLSGALPWWAKRPGVCVQTRVMVDAWREARRGHSVRVALYRDGWMADLRWERGVTPADSRWMLYVHARNGGSCLLAHGTGTPDWLDELGGVPT